MSTSSTAGSGSCHSCRRRSAGIRAAASAHDAASNTYQSCGSRCASTCSRSSASDHSRALRRAGWPRRRSPDRRRGPAAPACPRRRARVLEDRVAARTRSSAGMSSTSSITRRRTSPVSRLSSSSTAPDRCRASVTAAPCGPRRCPPAGSIRPSSRKMRFIARSCFSSSARASRQVGSDPATNRL